MFWILVLMTGSIVTVFTAMETIVKYQYGQTLTKVSVLHKETMEFPNPNLCVLLEPDAVHFSTDLSEHLLNDILIEPRLDLYLIEQAENISQQLTLVTNSLSSHNPMAEVMKNQTSVRMSSKLLIVLHIATQLVTELVRVENGILVRDRDTSSNIKKKFVEKMSILLQEYNDNNETVNLTATAQLIKEMMSEETKLNKLIKAVGTLLCARMCITIGYLLNEPGIGGFTIVKTQPCALDQIIWVGPTPVEDSLSFMCINLSLSNWLNFTFADYKYAFVLLDPYAIYLENNTEDFVMFLDFSGSKSFNLANRNVLRVPSGRVVGVSIEQRGEFKRIYNKGICARTVGYSDCFGYCVADTIANYCSCWPASWQMLAKTRPHQINLRFVN